MLCCRRPFRANVSGGLYQRARTQRTGLLAVDDVLNVLGESFATVYNSHKVHFAPRMSMFACFHRQRQWALRRECRARTRALLTRPVGRRAHSPALTNEPRMTHVVVVAGFARVSFLSRFLRRRGKRTFVVWEKVTTVAPFVLITSPIALNWIKVITARPRRIQKAPIEQVAQSGFESFRRKHKLTKIASHATGSKWQIAFASGVASIAPLGLIATSDH